MSNVNLYDKIWKIVKGSEGTVRKFSIPGGSIYSVWEIKKVKRYVGEAAEWEYKMKESFFVPENDK